jgi:membrane associated rhomboid family serine protease
MRGALQAIILTTVAVYLLQQVVNLDFLALYPVGPLFHPWQVVTYAFLHGGTWHIFVNMFALWMFGRALQDVWGSARFALYYFACVIAAAATQLAVYGSGSGDVDETGQAIMTMGASGGVFGVLLAFALLFPRERLIIIPIPIPLPAWLFVTLYGLLELFLGVSGTQPGVAHFAHLGGMLGGALLLLLDKFRRPDTQGPYGPYVG